MQSQNLKTLHLKSYIPIPDLPRLKFDCLSPQTQNQLFSQKNRNFKNLNISISSPNRYGNFSQKAETHYHSEIQINLAQILKKQNKCQTPKIYRPLPWAQNYNKSISQSTNLDRRIQYNFKQENNEFDFQDVNCCEQIAFGSLSSQFQSQKNQETQEKQIEKIQLISNRQDKVSKKQQQHSLSQQINYDKNPQFIRQNSSSSSENLIFNNQEISIINSYQNITLSKRKSQRFMSSQQISLLHGHQEIKNQNKVFSPFSKTAKKIISPQKQSKQLQRKKIIQTYQKQQHSPLPQFLKNKFNKINSRTSKQLQKQIKIGSEISLKVVGCSLKQSEFTFKVLKLLSKNKTTQVYLGCQKITNFLYCLKKSNLKINHVQFDLLVRQGKMGMFLKSPFLLKTFCTLYDDENNIYQLIEFMQGETLYEKNSKQIEQFVKRKQKKISCSNLDNSKVDTKQTKINSVKWVGHKLGSIRMIIKTLLQAVQCLHSQGIIHRDIKPANIFISHDNYIKLGDFGSCGFLNSKEYVGTLDYVAPQTLKQTQFDYSLDIWAIGCIAYELYTGTPPFYDKIRENTIHKIVTCQYDLQVIQDPPLKNFISKLLQKQKEFRLTAQQALNHFFISRKRKQK